MSLPKASDIREALYTEIQYHAYLTHARKELGAWINNHKGELNAGESIQFGREQVEKLKNMSENMQHRLWNDVHGKLVGELLANGFKVKVPSETLITETAPANGYTLTISID